MEKRYMNWALGYAGAAMVSGVFYREFTKFSGFAGKTNLSVMHTHYFLLGMMFFLMLMLLEKSYGFSDGKSVGKLLALYHVGLNVTALGFLMRGLVQVWGIAPGRALDASISGIAGIGHIMLGISIVMLLLQIRKRAMAVPVR